MAGSPRKQFSLSLVVRVFLAVVILCSIGIFANSVMKYNALREEEARLEQQLKEYQETRDELRELWNSEIDREYIIRVARSMGLYFPEEEIFYNDGNS